MRMRSTGLGKTELEADIFKVDLEQDLIIIHIQSTKPVRWHIRCAIEPEDRWFIVKWLFKMNFKIIKLLSFSDPEGKHPEPEQF